MEATDMWLSTLQTGYQEARHEFNDELYDYLMKKDDKEFWKVWL